MPPLMRNPPAGRATGPLGSLAGGLTRRRLPLLLGGLALGRPGAAQALPTLLDLGVIARAMSFLDRPLSGMVELGLVYGEADGPGQALAMTLSAMTAPIATGPLLLTPRPIALSALPRTRLGACLLLEATPQHARGLADAVAGRQTLTVTTDRPLVNAGLIVMAVRSVPRVEITVSRAAAQASGIGFAPAFRMLIQEY